jgi:hypothetical protein
MEYGMPWGTDKRLMDLLDLANSKGYTFTKAIMRDHVRLTDPEGRRVVKDDTGSLAFSYSEARRFLEMLADR